MYRSPTLRVLLLLLALLISLAPALPAKKKSLFGQELIHSLLSQLHSPQQTVRRKAAEQLIMKSCDNHRIVQPLIAALHDTDPMVRKCIASALAGTGDPRVVTPLLSLLADPNPTVRVQAAESLGQVGDLTAVQKLIERMQHDPPVTLSAIRALGEIVDERATTPLLAMVKSRDPKIGEAAAIALGNIGDSRAAQPLLALVQNPTCPFRVTALWAYGFLGDPDAGKNLLPLLKDANSKVRKNVVVIMGFLCDPRTVEPLISLIKDKDVGVAAITSLGRLCDSRALDALVQCANDQQANMETRECALTSLAQLQDTRALPALLAIAREEGTGSTTELRRAATYSLRGLNDSRVTDFYLEVLRTPKDNELRPFALIGLKDRRDPKAIDSLSTVLSDKDTQLRALAFCGLSKIPDPRAVQTAIGYLVNHDVDSYMIYDEAMFELMSNPAITADDILALLHSNKVKREFSMMLSLYSDLPYSNIKDPRILAALIDILARAFCADNDLLSAVTAYGTEAADALVERLKTAGDEYDRLQALQGKNRTKAAMERLITADYAIGQLALALARLHDPRAEKLLPALLTKKTLASKDGLLTAIGITKIKSALPVLLQNARKEENGLNQRDAIGGLGEMQDVVALPILRSVLLSNHRDELTLQAAAEALGKIGDARAIPILLAALRDDNGDVRTAAATALGKFPHDPRIVAPLLSAAVSERYLPVYLSAAKSLVPVNETRVAPALWKILRRDLGDGFAERDQAYLLQALSNRQYPRMVSLLIMAYNRPCRSPLLRVEEIEAMEKMHDPCLLVFLINAVKGEDARVRAAAVHALKNLTGQDYGEDHARWVTWWLSEHK